MRYPFWILVCLALGTVPAWAEEAPITPTASPQAVITPEPYASITTAELAGLLRSGQAVHVLDVRMPREDNGRRLPGAIWMHPKSARGAIKKILPPTEAGIIVYGRDSQDQQAALFCARLLAYGYTDVKLYPAGLKGWMAEQGSFEMDFQKAYTIQSDQQ
jgi:rhodanese-related sulfurtransferase